MAKIPTPYHHLLKETKDRAEGISETKENGVFRMWMTMEEIAEYLKVSKETIYKMAQKGQLPGSKLGNQWRFNRQVVDEWLKAHSNVNNDISQTPNSDTKEVANG